MKELNIIRAWKDAEYLATLTEAELAALPAHPSGRIELSDSDLDGVAGGENTEMMATFGCCNWPGGSLNTYCYPTSTHSVFTLGCCKQVDELA